VERKLQTELVKLPNLPSDKVLPGKTPADNVVTREGEASQLFLTMLYLIGIL